MNCECGGELSARADTTIRCDKCGLIAHGPWDIFLNELLELRLKYVRVIDVLRALVEESEEL